MGTPILLFYKYIKVKDPEELAVYLRGVCEALALKGRIIIAEEGINATVQGSEDDTKKFEEIIHKDRRFKDVAIKKSYSTVDAFPKLSIKVRDEIVGTRFPKEVDPRKKTAPHLSAEKLREWYEKNEDFVVIDMRNNYEFSSGHFKNSINPGLEASRDLPLVMDKLKKYKTTKAVTVCTGGVRCEKMSAYLLHQGFEDVYQLDGGMHTYMESYPGKDFLGTLYTFDNRDTMHFGGEREIVGICKRCEGKTEKYYNCANDACHAHFLMCDNCVTGQYVFCSDACEENPVKISLSKR